MYGTAIVEGFPLPSITAVLKAFDAEVINSKKGHKQLMVKTLRGMYVVEDFLKVDEVNNCIIRRVKTTDGEHDCRYSPIEFAYMVLRAPDLEDAWVGLLMHMKKYESYALNWHCPLPMKTADYDDDAAKDDWLSLFGKSRYS